MSTIKCDRCGLKNEPEIREVDFSDGRNAGIFYLCGPCAHKLKKRLPKVVAWAKTALKNNKEISKRKTDEEVEKYVQEWIDNEWDGRHQAM